jgi:putative SOS response-associated peptidase YedK
MCGRYAFTHSVADLQALFDVANPEEFGVEARYNIAPTQPVPIVFRGRDGVRRAGRARWGLVPNWVKSPSEWRAATFNARSEEAPRKPAFRQAFQRGRILVPASGFYEWKRDDGAKTPYHVRARDGSPLAFAGLMDVWRDRNSDERLVSCTVLTTGSRGMLEPLHDRMPVMVAPRLFDTWLEDDDPEAAVEGLVAAAPLDALEMYPVSTEVNSSRGDDPSFTVPIGAA